MYIIKKREGKSIIKLRYFRIAYLLYLLCIVLYHLLFGLGGVVKLKSQPCWSSHVWSARKRVVALENLNFFLFSALAPRDLPSCPMSVLCNGKKISEWQYSGTSPNARSVRVAFFFVLFFLTLATGNSSLPHNKISGYFVFEPFTYFFFPFEQLTASYRLTWSIDR